MGFTDIFKKSFLDGFNTDISLVTIFVVLLVSLVLGIFIYFVYKIKIKGPFYNKDFNQVLIGLPMITSAIVLSMQANIVVSLGMVGALSIVRFRNAVKNSMDLLYLFWSISIGIICGAQIYSIAFILTGLLTIIIFMFDVFSFKSNSYLLVMCFDSDIDIEKVSSSLKGFDKYCKFRSQVVNKTSVNCIFELSIKDISLITNYINSIEQLQTYNIILNDGMNRVA